MKQFLLSLATLTVCASSSYAATYIEPNLEGKILVKIDQIQIDSNTMRWMATYLAELAEQQAGSNDPKKLQASAKLIALAEQLDKSLPQISAANLKLKQGTQSKENEKRAEHKRKRLFGILEYLTTDESNSEGKLLVQLTKDALAAIVPEKSPLAQYSAPNQLWQNSIAKYDNFKRTNDPKIVSNDQIKYSKVKSIVKPKIDLPAAKPKAPEQITNAQWRLREFTVVAPLTTYKIVGEYNNSVYSTGLKKMAVKITPLSANDDLKFIFHSKPNHERDHLAYLTHRVSRPLQSQWKNIPSAKFTFQLSDAYSYRSDRDLTSSALTVAFDAALLGTSVKGNLLVIASIDHNAEFKRSPIIDSK